MAAETSRSNRPRRRVLFVCVGNSCRSQFAEAFARKLAPDVIEPASAGISPLGHIAEPTLSVGAEFGLTFEGHSSKGFSMADLARSDLIVNLTGMSSLDLFPTTRPVVDWEIDDPFGEKSEVYRRIAAQIETKVRDLACEFRAGGPGEAG